MNICRNNQLILGWRMALAISEKLASIPYVIKGFNYTDRAGPNYKPEKKKRVYLTRNASFGVLKFFTSKKSYDVP